MKIIFFSDIHGNRYALEGLFNNNLVSVADQLIFCGDVFGYYYYQNEILDIFRRVKKLRCILGNHDKMFLDIIDGKLNENTLIPKYGNSYKEVAERISRENIEFLRTFPTNLELEINGIKIGVFHGSPSDLLNGRVYPDTEIVDSENYTKYDYVILGHTHHKMVKQISNTTILNPGSLGQQRDGKGCSFIELNLNDKTFDFKTIEYDISGLMKDIDRIDNGKHSLKEVLLRRA